MILKKAEVRVNYILISLHPFNMSKKSNMREYEMKDVRGPGQPYTGEKPRQNSFVVSNVQTIIQIQQNEVAAEKSRRTSRLQKNLNPDVPRPQKVYTGKSNVI
jgi:hypothetical protein